MRNEALRIGIDFRPALFSRAGIARAVRETVRALAARHVRKEEVPALHFLLYGHSLAPARVPPPPLAGRTTLLRLPVPGRLAAAAGPWLAHRLAGRPRVFHYTDYSYPEVPVQRRIMTLHDLAFTEDAAYLGPRSPALLGAVRKALQDARLVLVPSRATAEKAMDNLDVHAGRIRVIPWGADHVARIGADLAGAKVLLSRKGLGGPYLLMPGTVEPRKNHERILRVLPRVAAAREMTLVVVGEAGWNVARILPRLRAPGILWLRGVEDPLLFGLMAGAHAVLYPSLVEGFGFPPLEAMALGVPCLAGRNPALAETCQSGALLVEPGDDDAMAEGLRRIVEDSDLRAKLAAAGPERAAVLRWEETARLHEVTYREAAAD